mmetsp:Transcript_20846/g.54181  ORF Transcript_20846/g.54181 Transcript_20846/m.54181 type:complete len:337 (+) Transcript_20846:308-1318(+)
MQTVETHSRDDLSLQRASNPWDGALNDPGFSDIDISSFFQDLEGDSLGASTTSDGLVRHTAQPPLLPQCAVQTSDRPEVVPELDLQSLAQSSTELDRQIELAPSQIYAAEASAPPDLAVHDLPPSPFATPPCSPAKPLPLSRDYDGFSFGLPPLPAESHARISEAIWREFEKFHKMHTTRSAAAPGLAALPDPPRISSREVAVWPTAKDDLTIGPPSGELLDGAKAERPKRPPNAFILWSCEERRRRSDLYSGSPANHGSATLRDKWARLSDADKALWKKKSRDLFEDFKRNHPNLSYHPPTPKKKSPRKRRGSGSGSGSVSEAFQLCSLAFSSGP